MSIFFSRFLINTYRPWRMSARIHRRNFIAAESMNDTTTPSATAPAEPKTLVEGAYNRLGATSSKAKTPGEKLRVEHLKDQYEVGAGTLREAPAAAGHRCAGGGPGQRGFRVAPISSPTSRTSPCTRVLLETEALRQSITRGDDSGKRTSWRRFTACPVQNRSSPRGHHRRVGNAHAPSTRP